MIVKAWSKAWKLLCPVMVTVWAIFQLAAVKVKLVKFAVAIDVSEEAILPMVTSAVGLLVKTMVYVSVVKPLLVTIRPEVGVMVMPAVLATLVLVPVTELTVKLLY